MSTTGLDRRSIIRGPGAIKLGNLVLHDSAGISADVMVAASPVATSLYGRLDQWINSRHAEVGFMPGGELNANLLAALFPYQNPVIGASICGAADVPLTVHSKAGTKIIFTNAALVACPTLRLSTTRIAFEGQAKFRCFLGLSCAPTDANALLTPPAAVAFAAADYPFDVTTVKGGIYVGTYNPGAVNPATPLIIRTLNGWTIDMAVATDPVQTDDAGLLDETLKEVSVMAKCTPTGLSEADLLALVPYAAAQGSSTRSGKDLTITAGVGSGALAVTLHNVSVLQGPMKYGTTTLRLGEIAFIAQRTIANSVPDALCTIAMAPNAN